MLSYFRKWAQNWADPTCKNMTKTWLLLIRAFISYQDIQEKFIILENSLKIWPKSQAEALATELPIKKNVYVQKNLKISRPETMSRKIWKYLVQSLCPENLKISRPETMFREIWKYPVQRLCPKKSEGERISALQAIYMDTSIYIMFKGREYPAPKPFIWIPLYTFMLYTVLKYLVQRLCQNFVLVTMSQISYTK